MELLKHNNFPDTTFEYYAGNKILVKTTILGVNTLIQVYKPGRYKVYSGYSEDAVMLLSMNGTGLIDLNTLDKLKEMTQFAINILNREKEGIIDLASVNKYTDGVYSSPIEYTCGQKKVTKSKYIPKRDLKVGHIYQKENGRLSLFLGNSHLYETDTNNKQYYSHSNRTNDGRNYSRYIYGSDKLVKEIYKGINVSPINYGPYTIYNVVILGEYHPMSTYIDSLNTVGKFIKDLGAIPGIPDDAKVIRFLGKSDSSQMVVVRDTKADEYIPSRITRMGICLSDMSGVKELSDALNN